MNPTILATPAPVPTIVTAGRLGSAAPCASTATRMPTAETVIIWTFKERDKHE